MADTPSVHPELATEQTYIDAAYARLDDMRASAAAVAAGFADVGAGGTHQARLERDVADSVTRRRLAALDIGDAALVFGRLDRTADLAEAERHLYIGRLAVNDEEQEPLVVDWRAPVAEPFYRATPVDADGRGPPPPLPHPPRRRAGCSLGIDDEVFDRDAADAEGLSVVGEAALLAALDRARTGRMGDIVATIQSEQDEAIRADLAGRAHRQRRPGHRQDRGRAPPRGVPALHAPQEAREPGRAPRGPEPDLPALHRPGAPVARRGRGAPRDGRRPQAAVPRARRPTPTTSRW